MNPVSFRSVSKSYPIYSKPVDRLAELATLNRLKRHDDYWALRDVSFEVEQGAVFCLVGENGSGKSTSLQLAAGIFPPTSGDVEVNGRVSALLELGAGFNPESSLGVTTSSWPALSRDCRRRRFGGGTETSSSSQRSATSSISRSRPTRRACWCGWRSR